MAVWGTRSKRMGDARRRSLRNEKFVPCEDPNESERPFAFVRLADEGSVASEHAGQSFTSPYSARNGTSSSFLVTSKT